LRSHKIQCLIEVLSDKLRGGEKGAHVSKEITGGGITEPSPFVKEKADPIQDRLGTPIKVLLWKRERETHTTHTQTGVCI